MDLRMPNVTGVEAIAAICAEFKAARIVVLTTYDGDEDIHRGLQAGAKGYLLKDAKLSELLNAVRTVHRGQRYISPDVGAKLVQRMSNPELSERELAVLRLVAQGMSNLEIATALSISESTVKSHLNRILSKLGVSDRTQAVIIAVKRGIVSL
jgi:two-component system NarL family response regulator